MLKMPTKIRITKINLDDSEVVKLILSFTKDPDTAIIVKEHQPKDHYHAYLEQSLSLPTIRTRLAQVCPTKNNDSYSVSTNHTDWKGYKGYLFKHEDTTVLHSFYDEGELRSYYDEVSNKTDKVKKYTEYTSIYNFVVEHLPDDYDLRVITKLIMKWYINHQRVFHKAHIAQLLNTIYYQLSEETDESFITSVLEEANILDPKHCELSHLRMENSQLKSHLKNYLKSIDPE